MLFLFYLERLPVKLLSCWCACVLEPWNTLICRRLPTESEFAQTDRRGSLEKDGENWDVEGCPKKLLMIRPRFPIFTADEDSAVATVTVLFLFLLFICYVNRAKKLVQSTGLFILAGVFVALVPRVTSFFPYNVSLALFGRLHCVWGTGDTYIDRCSILLVPWVTACIYCFFSLCRRKPTVHINRRSRLPESHSKGRQPCHPQVGGTFPGHRVAGAETKQTVVSWETR